MEKIKEAFTGRHREEKAAERELRGAGDRTDMGTRSVGDTEYTGGVAGGPAYGSTGMVAGETDAYNTAPVNTVETTNVDTVARQGGEQVCGAEFFTKVEDRPVVKERVEFIQEHRPVEKEFVVETRATGVEREVPGGEVEHLGTTERVIAVAQPKSPCE